jgi:MFS family permease
MGDPVPIAAGRVAPWKWGVVWLMFLATVINYMDRMTVNSTSDFLMREFGLDEHGYARVEMAFALSFGPMQMVAGYIVTRYRLSRMYAVALLVWSLAGFCTGLAPTIGAVVLCRIALGIAESFNWPCAIGAVGRLIPRPKRPLANAIFHGGTSIGAICTPLVVAALIRSETDDWRPVFMLVGAVGAVWVLAWLWFVRGERAAELDHVPPEEAPANPLGALAVLARNRKFLIAVAVGVGVNVCWHLYRIFLVRHLRVDLHYDFWTQQRFLAVFYLAADLGSMALGYLTRLLTESGMPLERVRQVMLFLTAGLCLVSTPAMLATSPWVIVPLLCLVGAGALGGFAQYFALMQDVCGRAALAIGVSGTVSWLFVALSTEVTGWAATQLGGYTPLFIAVGFVPLIGACISLLWPKHDTEPV